MRVFVTLALIFQLIFSSVAYGRTVNSYSNTNYFKPTLVINLGTTQLTLSGLVNAGLDGVITSGLSSAVYGTDFGAGVVDAITRAVVMGVAGASIQEVSDLLGHDVASLEKTIAKATVNCLAAQANGASCASGALGTLVVDLGLNDPNLLGAISQEDLQNRLELVAAIAGFFVSEGEAQNVNATVSAASLDFENNQALGNMSNFALGFQLSELNNRCTAAGGSDQDCAALQQAFISGSLQGQQEVAWLLLDFVPVVGDVKGILECIDAPSALTCGAAAASVVLGPGGDVARIVVRNGDDVLEMTVVGGKVTGGTKGKTFDDLPQITKNKLHHEQKVNEVTDELKANGYQVDAEVSFRSCDSPIRCRADLIARDENGRIVKVIEVKTGGAGPSPNQSEIYPQVSSGDAVPTGQVAQKLGLTPNVALKDQGYPNGIPVEYRTFEGVNQ